MKRDRRGGAARPCLKPITQNPGAITVARVAAGLEQRQLAEAVGISPSYMSEIEKGTRSARPAKLVAIAQACGVNVEKLMNPDLAKGAAALWPRQRLRPPREGHSRGEGQPPPGGEQAAQRGRPRPLRTAGGRSNRHRQG